MPVPYKARLSDVQPMRHGVQRLTRDMLPVDRPFGLFRLFLPQQVEKDRVAKTARRTPLERSSLAHRCRARPDNSRAAIFAARSSM
jgi:hypothetical protein